MSGADGIRILKEYWEDNVLNIVYVEEENMKSENKSKPEIQIKDSDKKPSSPVPKSQKNSHPTQDEFR